MKEFKEIIRKQELDEVRQKYENAYDQLPAEFQEQEEDKEHYQKLLNMDQTEKKGEDGAEENLEDDDEYKKEYQKL